MDKIGVLVIDDEKTIRQGLRQTIPWESLGFTLLGEANNGSEGLSIIENIEPDLIITDIRMPEMDGLELAMTVSEKYPHIKIVILSGFDDFQYAQKAIKAGVTDYVLKPVYRLDFIDMIVKVRQMIMDEKAKRKNNELTVMKANAGGGFARDRLILDLFIERKGNMEDLKNKLIAFGVKINFRYPSVALMQIDYNRSNIRSFAQRRVKEDIRHYLEGALLEDIVIFENIDGEIGFLFSWDYRKTIEEVQKGLSLKFPYIFTIGIGNPCTDLKDVYQSFDQSLISLKDKFYKGSDTIIYYESVNEYVGQVSYPEEIENEIFECVKATNFRSISGLINAFFDEIAKEGQVEIRLVRDMAIRLMIGLERRLFLEKGRKIASDKLGAFSFDDILYIETLHGLKDYIENYLRDIVTYLSRDNLESNRSIVRKALQLIEEDYQYATLSSIADRIFVTPTYLSLLFKTETGSTFIDQLTLTRMEKAKWLLTQTSLKNYEVAEKVGYSDARYFGQLFKKKVGISPMEYRDTHMN